MTVGAIKKYDIALSFAGEDRPYVEDVAESLRARDVRVFYDEFETVDLLGKDLYYHLIEVYQNWAQYAVIFISKHYRDKYWTNLERRAAQARALKESYEYIIPARFDDTEIEGISPTTKYIDLKKLRPQEVGVQLYLKLGRDPLKSKAIAVPSPRSPSEQGTVTLNYSNFDGRFRIGHDVYEFETMWTKASNVSIYCYTDPASIRGLALVPRGRALVSITDASTFDFTSRVRSPQTGQIVILQNTNGFYAALEITDIKDDTRGDAADELTFRYWILRDGSKDFSRITAS